ncbi:MAG: TetR/AcrR family transcriptional regulator [Bacteroidales bacterium]|nr:TetR/AcrR family transcriptional regulator [Bacteroidales bacterium]
MSNHRDMDVESRILEAATTVFTQKGLAGASMQDIADEARISRTSLHYYYRNKDKLFDTVFERVVDAFITQLIGIMNADTPLAEKLKRFVDGYLDFMLDNPGYVSFMVHDLNVTPERMVKLILSRDFDVEKLKGQIIAEMENNQCSEFDVAQFWASLIGMSIMPFVFKPMVTKFFLDESEDRFREFISRRKQHILDFLMKYIKN